MTSFNKILFIDDDPLAVKINVKLMSITNFCSNVICCTNGIEAINFLQNNTSLPDLIFVDINMYIMGAWEFLDWYKTWSLTSNIDIPVYVISSSVSQDEHKKSMTFNMVKGFFSKPITAANLKNISLEKSLI